VSQSALHRIRSSSATSARPQFSGWVGWKAAPAAQRLAGSNIIGITSGKGDQVTEANPAFLQMLGYSAEDLAAGPMSYEAITAPESAQAAVDAALAKFSRLHGLVSCGSC